MHLQEIVELKSGTPQFRISESSDSNAPAYLFYSQADLEADLHGSQTFADNNKQIRTTDEVTTLHTGDVIFSLISGKAAIVSVSHNGYLFTQNFVLLKPDASITSAYLAYILNEDSPIRKQLRLGQQGSITMKFSVAQLAKLQLPPLPSIKKQKAIGALYFDGLRLEALRIHRAELETTLLKAKIKEAIKP